MLGCLSEGGEAGRLMLLLMTQRLAVELISSLRKIGLLSEMQRSREGVVMGALAHSLSKLESTKVLV